jgi:phosphopantothenoylcysteine decarboxylase/phosphopantothenate--cysteine ligase
MADPQDILAAVVRALPAAAGDGRGPGELSGRRILVTAGPTHEPIDAVRFLGNRSSGRMGYAVAAEAAARGATVTLVRGPVALPDPPGVEVVRVETSEEMAAAVFDRFPSVDAVVMAAAVADFRPARPSAGKLKKEAGPPDLHLEPAPDILATLGKRRERQVLVGFAAETSDFVAEGRRKLEQKGADLLVVNEVGSPGTGFGAQTNRAAILSSGSQDSTLRDWTKADLAREICDRLGGLLRAAAGGPVGGDC